MLKIKSKDGTERTVPDNEAAAAVASFANPVVVERNCATKTTVYREMTNAEVAQRHAEQQRWQAEETARQQAEDVAKAQRAADMQTVETADPTTTEYRAALKRLLQHA